MPPAPEVWTVGRVLEWTRGWFAGKGIDSARLDAELLCAHAIGCDRLRLLTQFDRPLTDDERAKIRSLVQSRGAGTPVAYLIGRREFFGLPFHVTPDVLIPRPETEHLVEAAIAELRSKPAEPPPCFADIGTGSGAIAGAIARNVPAARGTATDLSEAALAIARTNAQKLNVADRIAFLQGDLAAPLTAAGLAGTLDLLAANLPYVAEAEFAALPADIRDHEPRAALTAGPDGLALIRRLVSEAPALLRPGGLLLLEVGAGQAAAVMQLLADSKAFATMPPVRDLAGIERIVRARKK